MKVRGGVFDKTTGLPIAGVDVDVVKRLPTPSVIATETTGSDGFFDYEVSGSPGLVDFKVESGGTFEVQFSDISLARLNGLSDGELAELLQIITDGVVVGVSSDLEVVAPGGMFVQVLPGLCHILTAVHRQYSAINLSIANNVSGVTRHDGVFGRLYRTGDDQMKTELAVKTGSLVPQFDAAIAEVLLADVSVAHNASSISTGNIADLRPPATFPIVEVDETAILPGTNGQFLRTLAGIAGWDTLTTAELPAGTDGQYLRTTGGVATWDTVTDDDVPTLITDFEAASDDTANYGSGSDNTTGTYRDAGSITVPLSEGAGTYTAWVMAFVDVGHSVADAGVTTRLTTNGSVGGNQAFDASSAVQKCVMAQDVQTGITANPFTVMLELRNNSAGTMSWDEVFFFVAMKRTA